MESYRKESLEMIIEPVSVSDGAEILDIYAPYILKTAVSFECEVPSLTDFEKRIARISSSFPYLKAVENGKILGYCYADRLKERAAYDRSAETTIYLREDVRRRGIGKILYSALEKALEVAGIRNLYACIAWTGKEDPYLNKDSVLFHERMGFSQVGIFHGCGYKFGRWYDVVWMEKLLRDQDAKG